MLRLGPAALLCLLAVTACSGADADSPVHAGDPMATAGGVRFSLPTPHRVVAEHRTAVGWTHPEVVFEDEGRECGAVRPISAGRTVAATLECDEHYAEDQAPTASVAVVSTEDGWAHRDLDGEAFGTPGLSPDGSHAVWQQDGKLLTWSGDFGSAPMPDQHAQVVTVDDSGEVVRLAPGSGPDGCTVEVTAEGRRTAVPVGRLTCDEVGLALVGPSEVRGDVSGQAGTEFVVRREGASGWTLAALPPVTAPGLEVYPDDPDRGVWNQVTANTRGDLVALGSPDRHHVTAQRYDRFEQRWTPARLVHDAGSSICRRDVEDAGVLQGRTFRLRLVCGGEPVVLRSRRGEAWRS